MSEEKEIDVLALKNKCGSCRYFELPDDKDGTPSLDADFEGVCRRNAPSAYSLWRFGGTGFFCQGTAWPHVLPEYDWCGEYHANEYPERTIAVAIAIRNAESEAGEDE